MIIAAFIINSTLAAANPSRKLLKGLEHLGKMDEFTVTSVISVEYEGDVDEFELINDASMKTSYAVNLDKLLMEVSMELLYDNKSIAHMIAGVGDKGLYAELPKLYDKKFSYEFDREIRENLSDIQVLLRYIRQANIKYDTRKYADIIEDIMGDDIKGSPGKIKMRVDGEILAIIMIEILEEMADDHKLMESVRKNAQELIKKILKDEHKFKLFDKDDLEDFLEYLEDEDDFEMLYLSFIEEMVEGMEYYSSFIDESPEFDVTISYGMFKGVKDINVSFTVENPSDDDESLIISMDSTIEGSASFSKVSTRNAVDIEEIMYDYRELMNIGEEIFDNLADNIEKNRKLKNAIEDLTGVDVDFLADELLEYILY